MYFNMEDYLGGLEKCFLSEDICRKEVDFTVRTPLITHKNQIYKDESNPLLAICTLPKFLTIRNLGPGYGIWSKIEICGGMLFGPYEGVCDSEESSYSWEVGKRRRTTQFIGAENEFHSNWLRYVNYACTEEKQNLIAYQYDGQIFYHTSKTIPPETELLVWYGNTYGTEIGLERGKIEQNKSANDTSLPKVKKVSLIYLCDICHEEYATDESQEAPKIFHSVSRHFICNKIFLNQQIHKNEKLLSFENDCDKKMHQQIHTSKKSFSCNICKKKFTANSSLKVHQTIHTGERRFSCNICKKKFVNNGNLKTHQRIHTGEKPFSCNICKKKFNQEGYVKIHQRKHTGEKPFTCHICKKKFTASSSLKVHQTVHTGEKRFSCKICKRKFAHNSNLKVHQRIHTGQKPFSCNICKNFFTGNSNVKVHQRSHTGEKPFSCNICKKKFTGNNSFKVHQRIHIGEKPFSCNICKKKFNRESYLKIHQKTHTGEKPFSCNICKKKFTANSSLKVHQRIHTNEKPFSCNICKKKFITGSNLKVHCRNHSHTFQKEI